MPENGPNALPGDSRSHLLHAVVGALHWRPKVHRTAAESFRQALRLAQVGPEQLYLTHTLERAADCVEH